MVPEARLERMEAGLQPASDGWFTLNVRDAAWGVNDAFGAGTKFEAPERRFDDVGYTLHVLLPGQPNGLYHSESTQEDFLVLAGECMLIIEGVERQLRAWDFVHCPPRTEHILVGAGEGPCVIFMIGSRSRPQDLHYPRNDMALRHGAGAERDTPGAEDPYAGFPEWRWGTPAPVPELPWNG